MTDILFYHLERTGLGAVLPGLLEKCLERNWKVTLRCGDEAAVAKLDDHLWRYSDDSFLPHGTQNPEHQPIYLTTSEKNAPDTDVLFLVEGATAPVDALSGLTRCITIFDGAKADHLTSARTSWKELKDADMTATYWKQAGNGGWEQKG
ncbi:MAG: DNA polymerase III subunit chi [Parvularculaceae bacterium]